MYGFRQAKKNFFWPTCGLLQPIKNPISPRKMVGTSSCSVPPFTRHKPSKKFPPPLENPSLSFIAVPLYFFSRFFCKITTATDHFWWVPSHKSHSQLETLKTRFKTQILCIFRPPSLPLSLPLSLPCLLLAFTLSPHSEPLLRHPLPSTTTTTATNHPPNTISDLNPGQNFKF